MSQTTTIKVGESAKTITLLEGKALVLTGSVGAVGVAYLLDPVLGGSNSSRSWAVGTGALAPIGPYEGTQKVLLTCAAGSIAGKVLEAVLVASGGGATKPATPVAPVLTALAAAISVAYTVPSDGGSAILEAQFMDINGVSTTLTGSPQTIAKTAGAAITGATRFRNAVDWSDWSPQSNQVTPAAATTSIISASKRARISMGDGGIGANNTSTTRFGDKSNYPATNLFARLSNAWVNTTKSNGPQEINALGPGSYRGAFVTKAGGVAVTLTSGGTAYPWTFNNVANGIGIKSGAIGATKLNAASYTAFAAAGGSVSSDKLTVTLPATGLWVVDTDPIPGASVAANELFYVQLEDSKAAPATITLTNSAGTFAAGTSFPFAGGLTDGLVYYCSGGVTSGTYGTVSGGNISFDAGVTLAANASVTCAFRRANIGLPLRPDLGDATKLYNGAGAAVHLADWSSLSGVNTTAGTTMASPIAVYGTTPGSVGVVCVLGDSINTETGDFGPGTTTLVGDADGCLAWANRLLNAMGYSWVRASIPGTNALSEMNYGGYGLRLLLAEGCKAVLTDMGHNNRSLPWLGAAGTGYRATMRLHWVGARTAMGAGGRVVATDLLPFASSTDNWATTANQTDTSGAYQWQQINPALVGTLDPSSGDPDAVFPISSWYLSGAPANGLSDVAAQKHPANGTANGNGRDTTHPGQRGYMSIVTGGLAAQAANNAVRAAIGF